MPHRAAKDTEPLFPESDALKPLAERMRPRTLDEIVGQGRLLGPGTPLRRELEAGRVHSMILWGPPGCGKTTLALLVAKYADAHFQAISAVLSGLAEVRKALAEAEALYGQGRRSVLFVDEVHRFNKAQQDAFLPHIEKGVIVFVGATTENPSFELNSALLSRCRVHVMDAVGADDIVIALKRALSDAERGLGKLSLQVDDATLALMARAADSDVRRALTFLEITAELAQDGRIDDATLQQVLADRTRRFDKGGEQFYDQISALHKSVRSSNPDAALYWLVRMLDGGCEPLYLARRMTRMAIEDVGLADPRAWQLALQAWDTYERLGSPEGELALAEVALYLAMAPKSNAAHAAYGAARANVRETGTLEVPMHLRNAPTKLMKGLGYGKGYQYDPDVEGGVALDQQCLPDALAGTEFYAPTANGIEAKIRESWNACDQRGPRHASRGLRLHAARHAGSTSRARGSIMSVVWYFDFISPFAWLQWPKIRSLAAEREVELRPILFAGLLDHHGQKGPAEIPGKREFTYRHVLWRARRAGRTLRFPPAHPFNPLAALRLCVAAGSNVTATDAIFEWIWSQGRAGDSAHALAPVAERLGIADVEAAVADPVAKARLRENFDAAIADGVFGVPTLALDGRLFWGDDAHDFALACLHDPALWDEPEMRRVTTLPIGVARTT
jgi:putative ATPase